MNFDNLNSTLIIGFIIVIISLFGLVYFIFILFRETRKFDKYNRDVNHWISGRDDFYGAKYFPPTKQGEGNIWSWGPKTCPKCGHERQDVSERMDNP